MALYNFSNVYSINMEIFSNTQSGKEIEHLWLPYDLKKSALVLHICSQNLETLSDSHAKGEK